MAENPQISKPPSFKIVPVCLNKGSSNKTLTECKPSNSGEFPIRTISSNLSSSIEEPNTPSTKELHPTDSNSSSLTELELNMDCKENAKTVESSDKTSETKSNSKSDEAKGFVSADSEDSSISKLATDGDSTEVGGCTDDVSMSTTSNGESKVVVQVLSNNGCGKISALEHCIDVSEVPIESETLDCLKENEDQVQPSIIVNEDRLNGKLRRTHLMKLHIRPGNGVRLKDIPHVVSNIEKASPPVVGFIHKMMFGSNGKTQDDPSILQTKQDILHFSGFSFNEDSDIFQTKRKYLQKVPYQMLCGMCNVLLGKDPRTRYDSVEDLLNFMLKPTNNSPEGQQFTTEQMGFLGTELSDMEKEAMKDSLPIVLVKKLDENLVNKLLLGLDLDSPTFKKVSIEKVHRKPKYIKVTGRPKCQVQLKSFPEVVNRVQNARRRIINLMHILLYGRPGSDEVNRLNILEFEGFSGDKEKNITRKSEFLKKLKIEELNQLCHIFSLRIKTSTKPEKVMKFLNSLQVPDLRRRYKTKQRSQCTGKTDVQPKKKIPHSERKRDSILHIKKLKDFENIRKNIECAPPEELIELSDLLFLMPCDNLEVHQRILDFPSSSFKENSPEFHSRRTLLYYMNFDIIKKIASILEITDWEVYAHPQDLATTLLRFLMEMKPPASIRPEPMHTDGFQRKEPSGTRNRPHLMRLQKDDSLQRCNYTASHQALHDHGSVESFHEGKNQENTSVVVRRITESSYSFTDLKSNDPVTISDCKSDESLSLYSFLQHPSKKQLEVTVREIVSTNCWSSTMGEIINKVFQCYPKFNLTYRLDYIKSKAIDVLHELQFKKPT
ncbi:hypothetical protein JTE90_000723 [Oedothorax gibbosus]|uniref:Uncharacterized protein n=1 Tax=Oedothorax gibbosus TaxID=931172 RepID=A0AAV6UMU2_9ARAC|nr:hypothetical protein JTE90_000723 [Oedothorax gibbosus]